jgi:hypothetical protein
MSEIVKSQDPLVEKFLQEAYAFGEKYPEEGKNLLGELMYYAASVAPLTRASSVWEVLSKQINFQVEEIRKSGHKTSAREFIKDLFIPNKEGEITADIIMARLQL